MDTNNVRAQIGHNGKMAQQRIDTKIQSRTKNANQSIQDQIAETVV